MYKSLLVQGFMKDDTREELTWPWPLHLQHNSFTVAASAQASSEQVSPCSAVRLQLLMTCDVRQVSLHLCSRQKQWLPQAARLEQAARQVLTCSALQLIELLIHCRFSYLSSLLQALAQVDNCWQPTKDRPALKAPDLGTIRSREQNCTDAPQVPLCTNARARVLMLHALFIFRAARTLFPFTALWASHEDDFSLCCVHRGHPWMLALRFFIFCSLSGNSTM
jgi:hypothetical protein